MEGVGSEGSGSSPGDAPAIDGAETLGCKPKSTPWVFGGDMDGAAAGALDVTAIGGAGGMTKGAGGVGLCAAAGDKEARGRPAAGRSWSGRRLTSLA